MPRLRDRRSALDPKWVRANGHAREVYGVSESLVQWREKVAEGRCRMCGRPGSVRPLTRHHIVPVEYFRVYQPRLWKIRNVAANIVPLCRPDHDLVEESRDVRRELRRCLAPDEVAFVLQVAGKGWLNARYPAVPKRRIPA